MFYYRQALILISLISLYFVIIGQAQAQIACPTSANTNPGFSGATGSVFGRIASQWDQYFKGKADANNGIFCNPTFAGGVILDNPIITNGASLASGTIGGVPSPSNSTDAANKGYVDSKITGIIPQTSVKYATSAILPNSPSYNNGSLGAGATLTASSNTALVIGSSTPVLNDRILVKNQSNSAQNGVYRLSQVGNVGTPWIITRVTDWDISAEMLLNSGFFVSLGDNAATQWIFTTSGTIVVGSSSIAFTQFGASNTYTGDNSTIELSGNVFRIKSGGTLPPMQVTTPNITLKALSKISNYTVVTTDTGTMFDNGGAVSEVDLALPAVSSGLNYCFTVVTNQILKVIPNGAQKIAIGTVNSTASTGNITSNTPFSNICIYGPPGLPNQWVTVGTFVGTWTVN